MSGLSRTRDNAPSKICIIRHSNFFYFFCKADSSHQSSEFKTYFLCKIKKNQNVDYYSFVKTSQAYKSCRMSRLIFCQKKKKKKRISSATNFAWRFKSQYPLSLIGNILRLDNDIIIFTFDIKIFMLASFEEYCNYICPFVGSSVCYSISSYIS